MGSGVAYRRILVAIALPDGPAPATGGGPSIEKAAAAVAGWWCDEGLGERAFTRHPGRALATRWDVECLVQEAGLRRMGPRDVLTVYVTGHGSRAASGAHHLIIGRGTGTGGTTGITGITGGAGAGGGTGSGISASGFTGIGAGSGTGAPQVYPTIEIAMAALDSAAEHVLVIVDSCHAGALHAEFARVRVDLPRARQKLTSLAVFTTADHDELPRVGEFAELLGRVDERLRTAGYATEHLSFDDFHAELLAASAGHDGHERLLGPLKLWPPWPSDRPSPCLPNPGHVPSEDVVAPARRQVADTAGELDYWLDRATGRPTAADPGWYFAGRRGLTTAVAGFLTGGAGILLVTGAAGTGKSAVIARAVTLSDPGFRADPRYAAATAAAPPETVPPTGSVHAAVLARNKDAEQVAADLLAALDAKPVPLASGAVGGAAMQAMRDRLREVIIERGATTIVIDGLDEARSPSRVAVEVIGPLARLADDRGRRPVRMIVGVRSARPETGRHPAGHRPDPEHRPDPGRRPDPDQQDLGQQGLRVQGPGQQGPGQPDSGLEDPGHGLLDLLRRATGPAEITSVRTDGPDTCGDIAAYLAAMLAHPGSPYATESTAREQVADLVARRVAPSFLDARIAGRRLRERADPQPLDDLDWLREGTVGQFAADLADVATPEHPAEEILAVLRATAFAPGAGIPWAEIWPAVTAAVLDRSLPDPDATIGHVLNSRLSGYLARDTEDGRHVWRPAHERLAEVLRAQPDRILRDQP